MAKNSKDFSSLEALSSKDINLNDYTLAQERIDERFGLIFFMRSKGSTRTLYVKERNKGLLQEHFDELEKRLQIANDYLLSIYGVKEVPHTDNFQIYFEDFTLDLQSEIKRHLAEKTRFAEAELYAVLYSAVSGLACLEEHGISHDFIVPMNLMKFSKDVYKIHDNFTISNKVFLYNQALRGHYQRYLAPELFESLYKKKEKPDDYDHHQADIFALGMCILDAGLLNTEGDYINRKLMVLDERALKAALEKFKNLYSLAMMQILEDMLFPDPSKRPCPSVLLKRLPGKPLVRGQKSGKKRKVLDQMINDATPEKFDVLKKEPRATSRSPRSTFPDQNRPVNLSKERSPPRRETQFEPLRRSYSPGRLPNYSSQAPLDRRDSDFSHINVSSAIKNDPVLAQYLKRMAEPVHELRVTSPRAEPQRLSSVPTILSNIPVTAQFPQVLSPREHVEVRYETRPEVHREIRFEPVRPEFRLETRYETRPDILPEVRYEVQPPPVRYEPRPLEVRYESRPLEVRYETRPTEVRYETRQATEIRYETRPEIRPEVRSEIIYETRPSIRETELRTLPQVNSLAVTQKPIYSSPLAGIPERPLSDTYKSTIVSSYAPSLDTRLLKPRQDEGPLKTYHLESLRNTADVKYLSQPSAPAVQPTREIQNTTTPVIRIEAVQKDASPKPDNALRKSENTNPKSKIDELISLALERSSKNLYLSQKVSGELGSLTNSPQVKTSAAYDDLKPSYNSASPLVKSQQGSAPLGTISERPVSENYQTPMDSRAMSSNRGNGQYQPSSQLGKNNDLLDLVNSHKKV